MNIARAAKGAASLLMVFGLVALVACQAGPAGTPGTPGAKGDKGDTGAAGAPGSAALQAKGDPDERYVILINSTGTGTGNVPTVGNIGNVEEPATSAAVKDLFVGGVAPYTYSIQTPATSGIFTASLKDNVIVVGRRSGQTIAEASYTTGTELTIRATDANGATADKDVAIRANRRPRVWPGPRLSVVVGTQSETYGTGATAKKAKNVATILNINDYGTNPYFSDDPATGNMPLSEGYTFEVTKVSRGTDDKGKSAEHVQAEVTGGNDIKLTGLKSTWASDPSALDASLSDTAAHVPVSVEVTATDPGGLKAKTTIAVTVDGAPRLGDNAPPATVVKKATGTAGIIIRNLDDFYTDPEGATAAVSIVGVALSPTTSGSAALDGDNHLTLTPENPGSATITYDVQSVGVPLAAQASSYLDERYIDRDGDGDADSSTQTGQTLTQVLRQTVTVNITPN